MQTPKMIIGWQEWCSFKQLKIPAIKAKIDTGAKTSALHAFDIKTFNRLGKHYVRFNLHPLQKDRPLDPIVTCHAPIIDCRHVISSNGIAEERYVIRTPLTLGNQTWEIEVTLSNRDPLRFRLLLGREAFKHHVVIEPSNKLLLGNITNKKLLQLYT